LPEHKGYGFGEKQEDGLGQPLIDYYWTELGKQISRLSSSPFIAFIIVT
jgi:hypothetical protein